MECGALQQVCHVLLHFALIVLAFPNHYYKVVLSRMYTTLSLSTKQAVLRHKQ